MTLPLPLSSTVSRRARAWIARALLLAFGWASLGPWPGLVVLLEAHHRVAAHDHAAGDHGAAHHHHDASEIPGSPTHPADHDCLQCQLLAHLARCMPPSPAAPTMPAIDSCHAVPAAVVAPRVSRTVALLPPARAPPSTSA